MSRTFHIPFPANAPVPRPAETTPEPSPSPCPSDFGLTPRHPLVPLPVATSFLNQKASQVMACIEDGRVRWAFDIRSDGAAAREVRILRRSLLECAGLYACVLDASV